MNKENLGEISPDKALLSSKRNYFLGRVDLHEISDKIGSRDQKIYFVKFKNGARTKLHYHEGGQVLVVTAGSGLLVLFKKKSTSGGRTSIRLHTKVMLWKGDVAYIPKNTLHWHGAARGKNLDHVAFNGFSSKGKEARTIWYDSDLKSNAIKIS